MKNILKEKKLLCSCFIKNILKEKKIIPEKSTIIVRDCTKNKESSSDKKRQRKNNLVFQKKIIILGNKSIRQEKKLNRHLSVVRMLLSRVCGLLRGISFIVLVLSVYEIFFRKW